MLALASLFMCTTSEASPKRVLAGLGDGVLLLPAWFPQAPE